MGFLFDVLDFPPSNTTRKEIEQKKNDVRNSAKAALISGTLTGLAICLETSMLCVAPLAVLTVMLISCLHNETRRLNIIKNLPLRDNNNSPTSPSSSSDSPTASSDSPTASSDSPTASSDSPTASSDSPTARQRRAVSAPSTSRY